MKVKDLMNREVVFVGSSATLTEIGRKMKENKIGTVLVLDHDKSLQGIITDRDIALAVTADNKDPKGTFAPEIMTKDPQCISAEADLEYALGVMNKAHIRRLPVEENGKVVGILSSADLAGGIKTELEKFIGLEEVYAKH